MMAAPGQGGGRRARPPQGGGNPKAFKSQPWVLFDTVVARSFLLGDTTNGLAIGSQTPAVSSSGEITFFNSGRTDANYPWYTNLNVSGQLAYGLEVWQLYLHLMLPTMPDVANIGYDITAEPVSPPGPVKLAEAIINFGVLQMRLGQEDQMSWPCHRFGSGGGVAQNSSQTSLPSNGVPEGTNVLKLPEPIEMPRTQNLDAKIRLAAEVQALIGTPAAPGVGQPLSPYAYGIVSTPTVVNLPQPPFAIQLGLVGRRVKKTQYGQIPE